MSPFAKATLLSTATRVLVQAMDAAGVRRLICITGVGTGDSRGHGSVVYDHLILPLLLRNLYADKDRQEAVVKQSNLDWTLVRPTVLINKPSNGQVRAMTDPSGFDGGSIPRADVSAFVVDETIKNEWPRAAPLITV